MCTHEFLHTLAALNPNEYYAVLFNGYEKEILPLLKRRATETSPTPISLNIRSVYSRAIHRYPSDLEEQPRWRTTWPSPLNSSSNKTPAPTRPPTPSASKYGITSPVPPCDLSGTSKEFHQEPSRKTPGTRFSTITFWGAPLSWDSIFCSRYFPLCSRPAQY